MTSALHMTRTQEKRFYRNAVQASLETFYGKSRPEATKLVSDWWSRLRSTRAFESGIFLHAEPMNTAANIADVSVIAITEDNRAVYHRLLDESRDLVLSKTASSAAQIRKMQTDSRKRLIHVASNGTAPVRGARVPVLAKKTIEKKPAHKQQVAYR